MRARVFELGTGRTHMRVYVCLRFSLGQVARINVCVCMCACVGVFELGTGHPHAGARACLSLGQVAHIYVYMRV